MDAERRRQYEENQKARKFGLETKIRWTKEGRCEVFRNWHEFTGVSMDDFIEGLKWLCDSDFENGHTIRELGITHKGELVKCRRVHYKNGDYAGIYREDTGLSFPGPSIGPLDRILDFVNSNEKRPRD